MEGYALMEKQNSEVPSEAATKQHKTFILEKDAEDREHNLDAN